MTEPRVLRVDGVSKRFERTVALDRFSLELRPGVVMALLGPSGCGKTTALRVVAGFERPDAGEVWVSGRRVAGGTWVPPERRSIGMVFQDWALFPHLDVWRNVAFGLPRGSDDAVREVIRLARLDGLERRMPHELSGGQQQRVALARALAPSPAVILLDEPFSNLDATLRQRVRAEVREVLTKAGATAIFVTHDQEEALAIADEIAVMDHGRVLQTGTPQEVYLAPADRHVARLVGEANLLPGDVRDGHVSTALGVLDAPGTADGPVEVMIRPETVRVVLEPASGSRVDSIEYYGHDSMVKVRMEDGTLVHARPFGSRLDLVPGTPVRVTVGGPVRCFPDAPAPEAVGTA